MWSTVDMSDDATAAAASPLSPDALSTEQRSGESAASPAVDSDSLLKSAETADADVVGAVYAVRDRFGAQGLRDLIALAERELVVTEQALAELAESQNPDGS